MSKTKTSQCVSPRFVQVFKKSVGDHGEITLNGFKSIVQSKNVSSFSIVWVELIDFFSRSLWSECSRSLTRMTAGVSASRWHPIRRSNIITIRRKWKREEEKLVTIASLFAGVLGCNAPVCRSNTRWQDQISLQGLRHWWWVDSAMLILAIWQMTNACRLFFVTKLFGTFLHFSHRRLKISLWSSKINWGWISMGIKRVTTVNWYLGSII